VTGKVWFINPPSNVILTLEDGKNQEFKIPNGQKFNVDGQMVDAWGLKKGMTVNATKVVQAPAVVVAQKAKLTGEMPPPPPPPPADVPILVVEEVAAPVQVAQATEPVLPKTGSDLPLIGFLGLLSLASSLGLRTARKSR
jgi:LPXTG-motif cell wall-anchored protein